jgi:SAM-dependent methyltransferase
VTARRLQTAYSIGHMEPSGVGVELDRLIWSTMYRYLRQDLGQPEEIARRRADIELENRIGQDLCEEIVRLGVHLEGQRVLDLGAGLGGLSEALARQGARVVSVEPGAAWRFVAARRLAVVGKGHVVGATGEFLPLAEKTVDFIVSLQVLEHVQEPERVIREAYRVLRPGGLFYASYENYLSFREPHYRVPWLPLLPKPIGGLYLRLLGRSPSFLNEAITYTTFPQVRRAFFDAGFECIRMKGFAQSLRSPTKTSPTWRLLKAAARVSEPGALAVIRTAFYLSRLFRTGIIELMRKPPGRRDDFQIPHAGAVP